MQRKTRLAEGARISRWASVAFLFVLLRFALWRQIMRLPIFRRYAGMQYLARRSGLPTWYIFTRLVQHSFSGGGTIGGLIDASIRHIGVHGEIPSWLQPPAKPD